MDVSDKLNDFVFLYGEKTLSQLFFKINGSHRSRYKHDLAEYKTLL